jgi:hypothetical protein
MERRRILEALRETDGNKKKAAEILGIHRSSLYAKMRRYDLTSAPEDRGTTDGEEPNPLQGVDFHDTGVGVSRTSRN